MCALDIEISQWCNIIQSTDYNGEKKTVSGGNKPWTIASIPQASGVLLKSTETVDIVAVEN